uniref:Copper transporter n=1 Tax=Panagrellus redivivus TaxID=6233 RepID=A0A7E4UT31_PANRE
MAPLYSIFLACLLAYAVPRKGRADCLGPADVGILDLRVRSKPNATFPMGLPVFYDDVEFRCKQCPAGFNDVIAAIEDVIGPHVAGGAVNRLQGMIDGYCCEEEVVKQIAVVEAKKEKTAAPAVVPEVRNEVFAPPSAPLGFPAMTLRELLAGHRSQKDVPETCSTTPSIEEVFADDIARADETIYEVAIAQPLARKVRGIEVLLRFVRAFSQFLLRLWCAIAIFTILTLYTMYIYICAVLVFYGNGHAIFEGQRRRERSTTTGTMTENYDADDEQTRSSVEGASSELDVTMDDISQSHA